MKTPQPDNLSTTDLMLELAARVVKDQREHSEVITGFIRLICISSQFTSHSQRRQTASDLRDLADELEAAPTMVITA